MVLSVFVFILASILVATQTALPLYASLMCGALAQCLCIYFFTGKSSSLRVVVGILIVGFMPSLMLAVLGVDPAPNKLSATLHAIIEFTSTRMAPVIAVIASMINAFVCSARSDAEPE